MNMIGNTTLLYLSISLAFIPRILLPGGFRLLTGSRGVPRGKVSTAPPQHVLNLLPDFYEKINIKKLVKHVYVQSYIYRVCGGVSDVPGSVGVAALSARGFTAHRAHLLQRRLVTLLVQVLPPQLHLPLKFLITTNLIFDNNIVSTSYRFFLNVILLSVYPTQAYSIKAPNTMKKHTNK